MEKEIKKVFNSKKDIIYVGLVIILIILSGISVIKIGNLIINLVKIVFDKYPTISVALITGLLAFISVPVGKYFENRYSIKNQIRKERQIIYIEFLNWLIKTVLNNEISNNVNIVQELKENQNKMVIYASDKVIKAWAELKDVAMNGEKIKKHMKKEEVTKYFLEKEAPTIENLILAIRRELGYKNKDIKKYDILNLYINDLKEHISV